MADALIGREQLWYGDLPRVCVKTGRPTASTVAVRFSRVPPWTFLLLFAGIVPFFIALVFVHETIRGRIPVSTEAHERYHGHTRWVWVGLAIAMLGPVAAILAQEPWLLLVAASGMLVLLVTEARRTHDWVAVRPMRDTPFVELRRVHPTFAAAVEDAAARS